MSNRQVSLAHEELHTYVSLAKIWVVPILWIAYILNPLLAVIFFFSALVGYFFSTDYFPKKEVVHPPRTLLIGALLLLYASHIIALSFQSQIFWCSLVLVFHECISETIKKIRPEITELLQKGRAVQIGKFFAALGFGLLLCGGLQHPIFKDIASMGAWFVFVSVVAAFWSIVRHIFAFLDPRR